MGAHAEGPEDARLHVRLEGHGERLAGGLRATRREGGLGVEGVREGDEEGQALPCRGLLSSWDHVQSRFLEQFLPLVSIPMCTVQFLVMVFLPGRGSLRGVGVIDFTCHRESTCNDLYRSRCPLLIYSSS